METQTDAGNAVHTEGAIKAAVGPILYVMVGVLPFPLAIWLLPMAEGLTGFGVLCVPFAVGALATYRGYRQTKSAIARGLFLALAVFYVVLILIAVLILGIRLTR